MPTTFYTAYDSDITEIAAASTHSTASNSMDVSDVETVAVQVYAEGENASISGNVIVSLAASIDGTNFDSQVFATVTLTKSGTDQERATALVNVRGINAIRVMSIENTDTTYKVQNVNVLVGKTII